MKLIQKWNPYLLFSPFLVIYLILITFLHKDAMIGDEGRYFAFAQNLLHGFYSPPYPEMSLWNGPGYPLLLVPFLFLHLPLICITLANGFFIYFSLVLLYKTLNKVSNITLAFFLTVFWGCYFNYYLEMPSILTESFSIFLITCLAYNVTNVFLDRKKYSLFLAGFLFGFLALTKIIFGYVILILLAFFLFNALFKSGRNFSKKCVLICIIAFATNLPYLVYTYNFTGKPLFWGNSGGMSLYWMSTPYDNEYGDWMGVELATGSAEFDSVLKKNHAEDYARILKNKGIERDNAFKKAAVENIKANPKKYLMNCFFNAERLLFDNPYSYTLQSPSTGIKLLMPAIVLFLTIACGLVSLRYRKTLMEPLKFLINLVIVYLGLSLMVSAYARQFYVIVPILLIFIGYIIYNHFLKNYETK